MGQVLRGGRLSMKPGDGERAKTLFSVHIPKTGGTSFISILERKFGSKLLIDDGQDARAVCEKIERGEVDCVHGHFPAEKYAAESGDFITWFRHPLDRLVSQYNFWRQERFPESAEWLDFYLQDWNFLEFALSEATQHKQWAFSFGVRLEDYKVIGITEFFDESLDLFRRSLKLDFDEVPHMRRTAPEKAEFDPRSLSKRDLAKIMAFHHVDFDIYARAVERFHQLCDADWGDGGTTRLGIWGPAQKTRPGTDVPNTTAKRMEAAGAGRLRGALLSAGGPAGAIWSRFQLKNVELDLDNLVNDGFNHIVLPIPAAMGAIGAMRPDLRSGFFANLIATIALIGAKGLTYSFRIGAPDDGFPVALDRAATMLRQVAAMPERDIFLGFVRDLWGLVESNDRFLFASLAARDFLEGATQIARRLDATESSRLAHECSVSAPTGQI